MGKWKAGQRELKCVVSIENPTQTPGTGPNSVTTSTVPSSSSQASLSSTPTTTDSNPSNLASSNSGAPVSNASTITVDEEKGVEESGYAEYLPPPQFPFINTSHFAESHW